jgi:hypothetical protein
MFRIKSFQRSPLGGRTVFRAVDDQALRTVLRTRDRVCKKAMSDLGEPFPKRVLVWGRFNVAAKEPDDDLCGTAFRRWAVAQVGNLLYRRLLIGRFRVAERSAGCQPAIQPTASRRYIVFAHIVIEVVAVTVPSPQKRNLRSLVSAAGFQHSRAPQTNGARLCRRPAAAMLRALRGQYFSSAFSAKRVRRFLLRITL